MNVRQLLSKLEGVKPVRGGWTARCPAHEDKNPSLSISESGGKILLKCFAGCATSAIVSAVGLSMADLFAEPKPNGNGAGGRIVATYDYADETGRLLFQVVRFEPKDFRQRRPDGRGGWAWNLEGVRRVLYRLPEVLKAKSVIVCEGEKDCDAAQRLGLVATCNPHGAGKWRPEYPESLRGKRVAVICDADTPGLAHGRDVARSLLGVAASVKLIDALPQAKDLAEWVERGGTPESLLTLIRETPELTAADVNRWTQPKVAGGFNLTSLGDLMREPEEQVSWLLEGILPAGGLSLLAAKPKTGKSTLARCLALAVAGKEQFLGRTTQKGAVIYLALEEKRSEVRAHFKAMGATGQEQIFIHAASAPVDALPAITVEVQRHKPTLLIIDPALRFVRVKDANDYAQVSAALEPILTLARENRAHVLLVYHAGKGERVEATDAILGSTAFFAAVDTALVMKRTEKFRTLQSRQRYGDDLAETTLEFNPESRRISLGVPRSDAEAEGAGRGILAFLQAAGEPKIEQEIRDAVKGETKLLAEALRELVRQGKVTREGAGKRGNPYRYGFSFACSEDIVQTSKRETEKVAETRMNTEPILVPTSEQKPILVPKIEEGQI